MKKPAPSTWIIIGLAAVIALLILFWPESKNEEITALKTSIAVADQEIKDLTADRSARLKEIKADSVRGIQIQDSLRTRLNAKSNEVIRLKNNPIVIRIREEVPEVDSLIVAQDSVIVLQEHRIAAYEHQLGKLQISMTGIIQNFETNLLREQERYHAQLAISEEYSKDLKKEKRRAKLAKVLIPVAFVGGLLLGIQ